MLFAYAQLALSMILVGINLALAKPILALLPIFLFCLLRHVIAVVLLLPVVARAGQFAVPPWPVFRILLQLSFAGIFLFNLFLLGGLQVTSALEAGLISSTLPALVAIAAWVMLAERPTRRIIAGVVLAMLGVAVVQIGGIQGGASFSVLGNLLVFAAIGCEALYTIFAKRLAVRMAPLNSTFWANLIALVLFTPFGIWQAATFDFAAVPNLVWGALLFYAASNSVLAILLWNHGVGRVPAGVAGIFTGFLPVGAIVTAILLLGETPTMAHAAGALLLAGSFALAVSGKKG